MKALVFNGLCEIIYEDYKNHIIEDDRNLNIQVTKCSICGSELHSYHGDKIGKINYFTPMVKFCMGYVIIGEIMEVGKAGCGCSECLNCRKERSLSIKVMKKEKIDQKGDLFQ